ncbi:MULTISPECIES: universal stress protein [Mycobacteriaceae]|uniref:universal stress protein n=1 Tax=Mycobacteriaceae TaxID=1762 RepID=UPI0007FD09BC|nr:MULTISPECIES: universal stress protein [Mycobacteriaceae]MCK0174703.1 universal stress protein [Mycolicibacterium sp. F2034L]OBB59139.1 universal stress protein [Mycobacterium sp. 852013-51886_SCH5428379]
MAEYRTIIVGTDGSESSLRAVRKAAEIAAESNAKLIVASAFLPEERNAGGPDPDQLSGEGFKTQGDAAVYDMLREAASLARSLGAGDVEERAIPGAAVEALVSLVDDVQADLLVVGNVGVNTVTGKLFGSVPGTVSKRAGTEVMVVDTTE